MESLIISPPKKISVIMNEYPKREFFAWQGLLVSFPNFCVYYTASIFTNCGVSYIRHESLQGMFLISS